MIRDIRIAVDFHGHPKRVKLSKLLDVDDAAGHLLNLWIRTAMSKPDGVLRGLDDMDIAIMAGWPKDPTYFRESLHAAGFLDQLADGTWCLHDWADNQSWVIGATARSDKAKKAALARHGSHPDVAEQEPAKQAEGPEHAQPVAPKMPEVGSKTGSTMLGASPEQAASKPGAMLKQESSNAPLLSSPSRKNKPPVRAKALTSPTGGKGRSLEAFEAWWAVYPLKVKRQRSWERWKTITGVDAPTLIEAVKAQDAAGHHVYQSGEKWPHPATWLKDRRWEDEIKAQGQAGSAAARLKLMRGGSG